MYGIRLPTAAMAALFVLGIGTSPSAAQSEAPADRAQIEQAIRDYLLAHPEVIVEALERYQAEQESAAAEKQAKALVEWRDELMHAADSPVLGNPEGDVTVVEFFDYRCPYCKSVATAFIDLFEKDGNVRFVMKEYPILGPDSVFAAKAALAAVRQGKYGQLHMAMMDFKGKLTSDDVRQIAASMGLDMAQLEKDMESPAIMESIERNFELGEALGVRGTPAFVVGDELVPGAISGEEMQRRIAAARDAQG